MYAPRVPSRPGGAEQNIAEKAVAEDAEPLPMHRHRDRNQLLAGHRRLARKRDAAAAAVQQLTGRHDQSPQPVRNRKILGTCSSRSSALDIAQERGKPRRKAVGIQIRFKIGAG
jgi:hypothetical protein